MDKGQGWLIFAITFLGINFLMFLLNTSLFLKFVSLFGCVILIPIIYSEVRNIKKGSRRK